MNDSQNGGCEAGSRDWRRGGWSIGGKPGSSTWHRRRINRLCHWRLRSQGRGRPGMTMRWRWARGLGAGHFDQPEADSGRCLSTGSGQRPSTLYGECGFWRNEGVEAVLSLLWRGRHGRAGLRPAPTLKFSGAKSAAIPSAGWEVDWPRWLRLLETPAHIPVEGIEKKKSALSPRETARSVCGSSRAEDPTRAPRRLHARPT